MSNVLHLLPKLAGKHAEADRVRFANRLIVCQTAAYLCVLALASWRISQLKQQIKKLS